MGWKVHSEEQDHFIVHGNAGPFRISKAGMSEGGLVAARRSLGKKKKPGTTEEREADEVDDDDQGFDQGGNVTQSGTPAQLGPADDPEAGGETPSPAEAQRATFQAEDIRQRNINRGEDNETGSLMPHGLLEALQDPAYVEQKHAQSATERAAAAPANTPSDAAPLVRPGEPGGPTLPEQPAQQQSSSQSLSLPPLPPMTDLNRVSQESREAQERGGKAADTQQQADSQQAAAMTKLYADHVENLKALNDRTTSELQSIQARNDKMLTDLQDPKSDIKPEHFWAEKGTFAKLRAGIGMILSGIGSGMTGQPNLAAQFIQKSIERDIEAQKANLGKKESALSYGMKLYGNHVMAADYARAMLTNTLAASVGMEGARTGDLRARATAEMMKSQLAQQALQPQIAIAQIRHQDAMMRYQMEFQRRLFEAAGGSGQRPGYVPSSAHPPMLTEFSPKGIADRNKDDNERSINLPGGQYTHAQTPKDAEEVKSTLGSLDNMEKQLNTLTSTAGEHPVGIHVPGTAARGTYETFRSSMLTEMNKLQGLNRLNGEEFMSYSNAIPSEKEWITGAGAAKAAAMKQLIQNKRMEEYRQKLGLRIPARKKETPFPGAQ